MKSELRFVKILIGVFINLIYRQSIHILINNITIVIIEFKINFVCSYYFIAEPTCKTN